MFCFRSIHVGVLECDLAHRRSVVVLYMLYKISCYPLHPFYGALPVPVRITRGAVILTWILGVASKQLRLLHGRVGDSTIVVNSLSPQMRELVEDAIAS